MAEGEGSDAIVAAIQSAESLLGSLLVRPPPTSPLSKQQSLTSPLHTVAEEGLNPSAAVDVEASLLPGQAAMTSPLHSSSSLANHAPLTSTDSSNSSTPSTPLRHHDITTMSLSQSDTGGIPVQGSSLLSLHGSGVAGGVPGVLSAGSHAVMGSLAEEEVQSLHMLSSRTSIGSITPPPDYDTVYRILTEREKDLELAARIGRSLLQRNELLETELGSQLDNRQQLEHQLAQLRHALGQKEGLLKLYAQDANEAGDRDHGEGGEGEGKQDDWIKALTEECRYLRESNLQLTAEADRLHTATAEVEQKEKRLVTQCLEQFAEAKARLSDLREREELTSSKNQELLNKLEELEVGYREEQLSRQQLEMENEGLREQLTEAQEATSHLTPQVTELQDKWEECSVLLKVAQDEVQSLKETSVHSSPQTGSGDHGVAATDHESIVQEIEEALRKEIIAASTLSERPSSPKQYALQRTQAVMATVRAATQAMARRQERLTGATGASSSPTPHPSSSSNAGHAPSKAPSHRRSGSSTTSKPPAISTPLESFNPIATSSPEAPVQQTSSSSSTDVGFSVGVGTDPGVGSVLSSSHLAPPLPLSPTASEAGSTLSLPDEASWLRHHHQHYVAPEKLQIVKPLEGSVTLLKWKLMASPQLGGATSFFSEASRPGIQLKGWKAAGILDRKGQQGGEGGSLGLPPELRLKSLSTNDLCYLATSPPPTSFSSRHHHPPHTPTSTSSSTASSSFSHQPRSRRGGPPRSRGRGIQSRFNNITAPSSLSTTNTTPTGTMATNLSGQQQASHDRSSDQDLYTPHGASGGRGGGGGGGRRESLSSDKEGQSGEGGKGNTSLLQQVGNLFSWSGLGLRGGGGKKSDGTRDSNLTGGARGDENGEVEEEVDSPHDSVGLAGIL